MRELKEDSKIRVQMLAEIMIWANICGHDGYAGHDSVYGCCRDAIIEIVKQETGVNIRNSCDWNMGGNNTYLEDIEIAIDTEREAIIEEYNNRANAV